MLRRKRLGESKNWNLFYDQHSEITFDDSSRISSALNSPFLINANLDTSRLDELKRNHPFNTSKTNCSDGSTKDPAQCECLDFTDPKYASSNALLQINQNKSCIANAKTADNSPNLIDQGLTLPKKIEKNILLKSKKTKSAFESFQPQFTLEINEQRLRILKHRFTKVIIYINNLLSLKGMTQLINSFTLQKVYFHIWNLILSGKSDDEVFLEADQTIVYIGNNLPYQK